MNWFFKRKTKIHYVADGVDWVISEIGKSLQKHLADYEVIVSPDFSQATVNDIIHFSNRYQIDQITEEIKSKKILITYYHGENDDHELVEKFKSKMHLIKFIVTSNELTKKHLLESGFEESKIVVIPIGIEVSDFIEVNAEEKAKLRTEFGVPNDSYAIGSFVKDGNGWGDGMEPKLIKGPDVFCDVIEKLNQQLNGKVFVVLTGPARGYVKKRLDDAKIPYIHKFLDDYSEIVNYYNLIDLYIIPARLEGGPRSVLEAPAAGVPVVSTRVGMVPEIIENGVSGFITEIEDVDKLTEYSKQVLLDKDLAKKFVEEARKSISRYDYGYISNEFNDLIYKKLK